MKVNATKFVNIGKKTSNLGSSIGSASHSVAGVLFNPITLGAYLILIALITLMFGDSHQTTPARL